MSPRPLDLDRPWGRMRVWTSGTGPTVLAIHGLGGSGRYWDGLANALGPNHRVIAPDLAGFGASDEPAENPTRESHLDDLVALLDRLGGQRPATVLGHSMGGVVAALLAAREPHRVGALAVAASPFPGDGDLDFRHVDAPHGPRRTMIRAARGAWPVLAPAVAVIKRYPYAIVRDFGRQSFRARVWSMWSVLSDPSVLEDLAPLRSRVDPSLLLDARDDPHVPPEDRERWSALIPDAEQLLLPTGAHQVLLRSRYIPLADWVTRTTPLTTRRGPDGTS